MNKYSSLSRKLPYETYQFLKWVGAEKQHQKKGKMIIQMNGDCSDLYIVEEGMLYLIGINSFGEKSISDYYEPGDIFGTVFFSGKTANLYYVATKTDCDIQKFSYKMLTKRYDDNSVKYLNHINDLILSSIRRNNTHNDILMQRTIRNKLITYFNYISAQNNSSDIYLPLTLSDIADYISVDRSAMMREIKKMNTDGIISSKGQKITLIKTPSKT